MATSGFSSAAVTSSCDDISHRAISTSAELDTLLKGIDPGSMAAQHLISLSAKLDQFKQTTEQLRQSLTGASAMSPGLRNALSISFQPCADGAAIVDKQIRRLDPGNVAGLNPDVILQYEDFHNANTRLFRQYIQVLKIPTANEQDSQLAAPDGHRLLENAVEASQIVLTRSDILDRQPGAGLSAAEPPVVAAENEPQTMEMPPEYIPGKPDKGKRKVSGQIFSSLSNSFKAMTASLRPKPEPMVIAMCEAAKNGDLSQLKGFVSQGVKINSQNGEGYTALICAIRANRMAAVELLVTAGADKSTKDSASGKRKPPLFHAAELGFIPIAEYLIDKGADMRERSWSGQPFFIEVANSDQLDIINLFLTRGCDPNMTAISGRTIFVHAVQNGSLPHIRLLHKFGGDVNARDITGQPSLHAALGQNRLDIVSWLLEHGADPNVSDLTGNTMIVSALHKKNYELVKMLLTRGADPNATGLMGKGILWTMLQNKDMEDNVKADLVRAMLDRGANPNQVDNWGESIMSLVVTLGNTDLLRTFLAHGGNPNKSIKDDTFLLYAIDRGRHEHVKMLLSHGADVNGADNKGRLPLTEALQMNNRVLIELLLQFGADVNKMGPIKPLALAQLIGNQELVQMLTERGAEGHKKRPAASESVPNPPAAPRRTSTAAAQVQTRASGAEMPPPYTEAGFSKESTSTR
ncbi:putative ankyrin repeat protein [Colletotrichum orbiculare MAFF 240422]|uniref:Ankyrin repeat protein n=1 Tax=Colletotrichum orbiculare (strain 104-T / ATCC 96160 / CBS 514.97 / LARS 414 / MAFF 240422) TaxID=1213857 RepID=N4VP08_COLOR|nr:putative ankyrin repeat protein [Colletotrichum orbiculare MAFF 240422]